MPETESYRPEEDLDTKGMPTLEGGESSEDKPVQIDAETFERLAAMTEEDDLYKFNNVELLHSLGITPEPGGSIEVTVDGDNGPETMTMSTDPKDFWTQIM